MSIKLRPRLITSLAARSIFDRPSPSLRHPSVPLDGSDGLVFPARNYDPSTGANIAVKQPPSLTFWLWWLVGIGLAAVYFVWFFANLFQNGCR